MTLRALVTTVGSAEDARRLADAAVSLRLAACVQVTTVESVYRWQGEVQHEPEWRLLFKTTEATEPALRSWLLAAHPYELPALYALDLTDPTPAFADWVAHSTAGSAPREP
jgi:periplasmic divalent cation tolerance protein